MPKTLNGRTTAKLERIEARVRPDQKSRIEYAARLRGTSVSEFMVRHSEEAALRTIQEHELWTLRGRDQQAFVRAILNPRAPSARLKAAYGRYQRHAGK